MSWIVLVVLVLALTGAAWMVGKLHEGKNAPVSCIGCGKCIAAGECVLLQERNRGKKADST